MGLAFQKSPGWICPKDPPGIFGMNGQWTGFCLGLTRYLVQAVDDHHSQESLVCIFSYVGIGSLLFARLSVRPACLPACPTCNS